MECTECRKHRQRRKYAAGFVCERKKKSDTNPSTDTMSHWFKWNVSNIVKNWVGNTSDIEKGIEFYALPMLEGSSVYASYMKTFGSVQADSKYRPYFI